MGRAVERREAESSGMKQLCVREKETKMRRQL